MSNEKEEDEIVDELAQIDEAGGIGDYLSAPGFASAYPYGHSSPMGGMGGDPRAAVAMRMQAAVQLAEGFVKVSILAHEKLSTEDAIVKAVDLIRGVDNAFKDEMVKAHELSKKIKAKQLELRKRQMALQQQAMNSGTLGSMGPLG